MMLELRDLRLVVTLVATGSMTEAARRLNVTQPALSKHLRTIEQRLGATLFNRNTARMAPTAVGEMVLRHGREMLDRAAEAESELQSVHKTTPRSVRVGTDCYTGYHWLPQAISRFGARQRGTDIEIAFDAVRQPLKFLRTGTIDLALVTSAPPRAGIIATPLFSDEYIAVVAPSHRLASAPYFDVKEVANERLLLMSPPESSTVMRVFVKPSRIKPKLVADVQLLGAVAALAESGYGVGMVPNWTIAPEIKSGRLVPLRLGPKGLRRTWMAAALTSRARERWVQDFAQVIATVLPVST